MVVNISLKSQQSVPTEIKNKTKHRVYLFLHFLFGVQTPTLFQIHLTVLSSGFAVESVCSCIYVMVADLKGTDPGHHWNPFQFFLFRGFQVLFARVCCVAALDWGQWDLWEVVWKKWAPSDSLLRLLSPLTECWTLLSRGMNASPEYHRCHPFLGWPGAHLHSCSLFIHLSSSPSQSRGVWEEANTTD